MASVVCGTCDPAFAPVRELFERQFADGTNCGASVAVVVDGVAVVDLWGGAKDQDGADGPWEEDTVVNTFSCCKAWTALCAHVLAERGHLAYDAPVARYWPEFGEHGGKSSITVRQVLCHSSGLQALREPVFDVGGVTDWGAITSSLARQAPLWPPGSRAAYHAFTFGHLVGEIVRRADHPRHRSPGTFFREEVLLAGGQ